MASNNVWLRRLCAAGAASFILALVCLDAARNYKPAKEWQTTLGNEPLEMSPDGALFFLGTGASESQRGSPSIPAYAIATYGGLILIDPMSDHVALTRALDDLELATASIRAIVLMNDNPARRAAAQKLAERTGATLYASAEKEEGQSAPEGEWDRSSVQPLRDGQSIQVGDTRVYIMAARSNAANGLGSQAGSGGQRRVCLFTRILRRNVLFTGDMLGELLINGGRNEPALAQRIAVTPIDLMLPNAPFSVANMGGETGGEIGGEFDAELAADKWRQRKPRLQHDVFGHRSVLGSAFGHLFEFDGRLANFVWIKPEA